MAPRRLDIYCFASVLHYGGFSPAARTSGVEKTRLSQRIAALEKRMGVRLVRLAVLDPMWFEGALRTPWRMRDKTVGAGAATAFSAAPGALFFLLIAVVAALAYSIVGSGNHMLTSGQNDFVGRLPVDFVPAGDAYHGRGV